MDHQDKRITQIDINIGNDESGQPSTLPVSNVSVLDNFSSGLVPKSTADSLGRRLRKRAPLQPSNPETSTTASLNSINLSKVNADDLFKPWPASPWKLYRRVVVLHDLGGDVTLAIKNKQPYQRVNIREFPKDHADKTLDWFRRVRHCNIVETLEVFQSTTSLYIVLEEMDMTLEHIVQCVAYPTERQLASILGQILEGLVYLHSQGLEHGSLSCTDILLNLKGDVKIANQQHCQDVTSKARARELEFISMITMRLMQKYVKDNEAVGIDNPERWPPDSNAVAFLSATTSALSASELLQHPIFIIFSDKSSKWEKESLVDLILLARVSVKRYYHYKR